MLFVIVTNRFYYVRFHCTKSLTYIIKKININTPSIYKKIGFVFSTEKFPSHSTILMLNKNKYQVQKIFIILYRHVRKAVHVLRGVTFRGFIVYT